MAPTARRQFVAAIPFLWPLFPLHRRFGLHDHAVFTTCSLTFVSLLAIVLAIPDTAGVATWVLVLPYLGPA